MFESGNPKTEKEGGDGLLDRVGEPGTERVVFLYYTKTLSSCFLKRDSTDVEQYGSAWIVLLQMRRSAARTEIAELATREGMRTLSCDHLVVFSNNLYSVAITIFRFAVIGRFLST